MKHNITVCFQVKHFIGKPEFYCLKNKHVFTFDDYY